MTYDIELVIFVPQEQVNQRPKGIPVPYRNLSTYEEFKHYFANLRTNLFIVILFSNASNAILNPVLEETEKSESKRRQIIHVLICGDRPIDNLTNNTFVSELLLTYKVKATFARFLDRECIRQHNFGNINHSSYFDEQRRKIFEHADENDELEPTHILCVGLNTTPKEVHNMQQCLTRICHNSCAGEHAFIIRTLSHYIPEDEMDVQDDIYLQNRYKGDVCHTIMKLSSMRFYVMGTETHIQNPWSKKLIAAEANINEEHALKYVDRCTFITNQHHVNQTSDNLVRLFGRNSGIRQVDIKTPDEVADDIHFHGNLQHIHPILEKRKMIINSKSYQPSSRNFEEIPSFSDQVRPITQAQNSPVEKQDRSDIIKYILSTR